MNVLGGSLATLIGSRSLSKTKKYLDEPGRRKALMELMNTAGWWIAVIIAFGFAYDDDEKYTYEARFWRKIGEDISMGISPYDMLHSIDKPIAAFSKLEDVGTALLDYLVDNINNNTTAESKRNYQRGLKTIMSSIPILNNAVQFNDMVKKADKVNDDYILGIFPVRDISGR